MSKKSIALILFTSILASTTAQLAYAGGLKAADDFCLEISLTGTMGGPAAYKGNAGPGTLVKYGSLENNCGDIHLQFDTGRATTLRLAELGVPVNKLDAVFITHLHSDHTVGLIDLMQTRWHFFGKPIDLVCSADYKIKNPIARNMSCTKFGQHIADASIQSGEIAQRSGESGKRNTQGPASIINTMEVALPLPTEAKIVWQKGDVSVSAIASKHIPGHLSYRVDTPQGSVVIGGDAGNDKSKPPRANSTSAAVEKLSQGADVLVHSTMHPVFGPANKSNFPAALFFRQSTAGDLGAMAKRAGVEHLMLTHLIPALGAKSHGPFKVPGEPLSEDDYLQAVNESDYSGKTYVGKDLMTLRLPIK